MTGRPGPLPAGWPSQGMIEVNERLTGSAEQIGLPQVWATAVRGSGIRSGGMRSIHKG